MANVTNYNFDYDMSPVVLWQYNDAERLKAIIANEQAFLDENVSSFYKDFNRDVLNIATANTFGLNVWGILLGVPRPNKPGTILKHFYAYYNRSAGYAYLDKALSDVVVETDQPYVYDSENNTMTPQGTIEAITSDTSFQWVKTPPSMWYYTMERASSNDKEIGVPGGLEPFSDEQYRLLLRARIYLLTFDGSARALNEFFHILFPDLQVTVTDNGDMTADISVLNEIDPEIAILFQNPYAEIFLPRPSGVRYNTATTPMDLSKTFTFEGMTDENGDPGAGFDTGTFAQG